MFNETQALPEDPAELRVAAEGLVSLVKAQALRIAKLEHQLAGLRRHRFGSTSERLDQLQLRLEDEEIAATEADEAVPPADPAAVPRGKPKRKPLPADLLRHEGRAVARRRLRCVRRQAQNAGRGCHRRA